MWQDQLRTALQGIDREFWPKAVADGATAGRWPFDEAYALMQQLREAPPPPPKAKAPRLLPTLRRLRFWDARPALPSGQHLGAMSLDPFVDWAISDGAARCLGLIRALAGPAGRLLTLTRSLATRLGRHRNTAGVYLRQLVAAGHITTDFDRRTGQTLIVLAAGLAPRARPAGQAAKPWPRTPQPQPFSWSGGALIRGRINPASQKEGSRGSR